MTTSMKDMDLNDLLSKEKELSKRLRAVCTPYSYEKRSKLSESTEIFYEMGNVYLRKAALTKGMDQKLNFVKSAVLLHGARVRSEKFLRTHLHFQIHNSLRQMETLLFERCPGSLKHPLTKTSKRVLSAFESYRDKEKRIFDSLTTDMDRLLENEVEKNRDERIECVKKLLHNNSEIYKTQIQMIAKDCLEILGPKPCEFAILGFGSLARNEVTLYSPFEHAIILEEGIQNSQDYQKILEYFRWFSVIFHVSIIGLGETPIPNVAIETLNDPYSADEAENWFRDRYTPPGVSFDGTVLHAGKIPREKRGAAQSEGFIVELLQPVSRMVSYLSEKEGIMREYFLPDVLCDTCFVFGSEDLFFQFKAQSEQILKQRGEEPLFIAATSNAKKNFRNLGLLRSTDIHPKNLLYQSLSIFIRVASSVHGALGNSGFERALKLADALDSKSLQFAFALANEIRMKNYALSFTTPSNDMPSILDHEQMPLLSNCSSAIAALACFVKILPFSDESKSLSIDILGCGFLEVFPIFFLSDTISSKILENMTNFPLILRHSSDAKKLLANRYFEEVVVYSADKDNSDKAEKALLEIETHSDDPRVCAMLSQIKLQLGQNEEAKKLADDAFVKFEDVGLTYESLEFDRETSGMGHDHVIKYCNQQLSISCDAVWQMQYITFLLKEHLKHSELKEASQMAESLVKVFTSENEHLGPSNYRIGHTETFVSFSKRSQLQIRELSSDLFFAIRKTQILANMEAMELNNFIKYCNDGFRESSDVVSKLLFGYQLAVATCRDGQREEARQILKTSVSLLKTTGVKVIHRWRKFQWMEESAWTQYYENWIEDYTESWESVDDIIESGPIAADRDLAREKFSFCAVESYIRASLRSNVTSVKLILCKKALEIIQRPENVSMALASHSFVLEGFINICRADQFKEFKISEFCEIFNAFSKRVQEDDEVQDLTFAAISSFHAELLRSTTVTPLEICHALQCCHQLIKQHHPYLYPALQLLILKIGLNAISMQPKECFCICDLSNEIKCLWRSLSAKLPKRQKGTITKIFLSRVYCYICHKYTENLMSSLTQYIPSDQNFKHAIVEYTLMRYESATKLLWKIACEEKRNSHLQRMSITFLCNAIIHVLEQRPKYATVVYHNQLSIVLKELEETFSSEMNAAEQRRKKERCTSANDVLRRLFDKMIKNILVSSQLFSALYCNQDSKSRDAKNITDLTAGSCSAASNEDLRNADGDSLQSAKKSDEVSEVTTIPFDKNLGTKDDASLDKTSGYPSAEQKQYDSSGRVFERKSFSGDSSLEMQKAFVTNDRTDRLLQVYSIVGRDRNITIELWESLEKDDKSKPAQFQQHSFARQLDLEDEFMKLEKVEKICDIEQQGKRIEDDLHEIKERFRHTHEDSSSRLDQKFEYLRGADIAHSMKANLLQQVAAMYLSMGSFKRSIEAASQAINLLDNELRDDKTKISLFYLSCYISEAYIKAWNQQAAVEGYEKARKILRSLPDTMENYNCLLEEVGKLKSLFMEFQKEQNGATLSIDRTGGTINLPGGIVHFDRDSVSSEVQIHAYLDFTASCVPNGKIFITPVLRLNPSIELQKPALVKLATWLVSSESDIKICYRKTERDPWKEIESSPSLNEEQAMVEFEIDKFCQYATSVDENGNPVCAVIPRLFYHPTMKIMTCLFSPFKPGDQLTYNEETVISKGYTQVCNTQNRRLHVKIGDEVVISIEDVKFSKTHRKADNMKGKLVVDRSLLNEWEYDPMDFHLPYGETGEVSFEHITRQNRAGKPEGQPTRKHRDRIVLGPDSPHSIPNVNAM